jgi:acetyl-CoA carboxylase biotin carboxyl carrier protein
MTLDEIKRLIEFIRAQELTEFELEQDGVKLRIKSGSTAHAPVHVVQAMPMVTHPIPGAPAAPNAPGYGPAPGAPGASVAPASPEEGTELAIVKSPIVGTFYRAPEPGAKNFIEVGDTVKKGQVLCIIEAMKLMNEIDSEFDGEVVNIYVENGQAVQYGERLFAIKPRT